MNTSGPVIGYEEITVPLCEYCRQKRFGYDCPECGLTYSTHKKAMSCCQRRPGESPDCHECGRRMERTVREHTEDGAPTCEAAECEPCGILWGKYTGWDQLEELS